jgi:putative ABC transport system permease protein
MIASTLLPQIVGNSASFGLLFNAALYIRVILVFIGSILFSGVYPALLLSRLKPVSVLKGKYTFSKTGVLLRKGMVAFQFTA